MYCSAQPADGSVRNERSVLRGNLQWSGEHFFSLRIVETVRDAINDVIINLFNNATQLLLLATTPQMLRLLILKCINARCDAAFVLISFMSVYDVDVNKVQIYS